MRPVDKWNWPGENGEPKQYSPYGTAKEELEDNLGSFCSYCEISSSYSGLDVEHVQPRGYIENGIRIYEHLEESWDNFLLSCKNCNSIKGKDKVEFDSHVLPHKANTFQSFKYLEGGLVVVNPDLSESEYQSAANTLNLLGLDRRPGHPEFSRKDKRWKDRLLVWLLAERYLERFLAHDTNLDDLIEIAHAKGFWSVWMTVFEAVPEVKTRLIQEFPGTCQSCFDENGNSINTT